MNTTATEQTSGAQLVRVTSAKLGENRKAKRVYLQGRYLLRAGFAPASTIEADFQPGRVTLRLAEAGSRVVSSKNAGDTPVIDINSNRLRESFGEVETLQVLVREGEIVLTPKLREQKRRSRCRNGRSGSIFGGTGLLAKAAERAGFRPAFCIELDEANAENYARNFPESLVFNLPVEEVDLSLLPPVELIEIGVPCEPFSNARSQEKGTGRKRDRRQVPEAHPNGDLTMWAAMIVSYLNPAHVIIECVPEWLTSGMGEGMRHALTRMGYKVDARIVDSTEYGEVQMRERAVMLASSDDEPIRWPRRSEPTQLLGDLLDAPERVEGEWFTEETKAWIFRHWREQKAKGNNFASAVLTSLSRFSPGIKKRYLSQQGDNPVIAHPTRPDCYRFFTLREICRLFGLPEDFTLPAAKTVAGEMVAQGVIVTLFEKIIKAFTGRAPECDWEERAAFDYSSQTDQPQLAFTF